MHLWRDLRHAESGVFNDKFTHDVSLAILRALRGGGGGGGGGGE